MWRAFVVVALIGLAGCQRAAEKAVADYEWIEQHGGSQADKCEAAKKAAAAWRERYDDLNYRLWSIQASQACDPPY